MSTSLTTTERTAQRCAFCKIDLRGRFVFANTEAEELFGASQVEIFGHPLTEFLDTDDHRIIKEIISHSSHFETTYDSAPVTLVRRDGARTPVIVILSLNFRGGTPVNYEIIITPTTAADSSVRPNDSDLFAALDTLLNADVNHPSQELAEALCCFTGAASVRVFDVDSRTGTIAAEASCPDREPDSFATTVTVERTFSPDHPFSAQFVFVIEGSDDQEEHLKSTVDRAINLLSRSSSNTPEVEPEPQTESTPATPDIFERLALGFVEFDSEDAVTSFNQPARQLLPPGATVHTFDDIMAILAPHNDPALIERLRLCRIDRGEALGAEIRGEIVTLPNGDRRRLLLCAAGPGRNGCLLVGYRENSDNAAQLHPVLAYLSDSLTALEASVRAVDGFCQNLEHENYGELRGHGGFYLKSLRHQWNRVDESLHELHASVEMVRKDEAFEVTDPALILSRAFEDAVARRAEDAVELKLPDLPKLTLDRNRLTPVVRSLMVHLANAASSYIKVEYQPADDSLVLRFAADTVPSARACFERNWQGTAVCASDITPTPGGRTLTLAAARSLAAASGGRIALKSSDQNNLVFELSWPSRSARSRG